MQSKMGGIRFKTWIYFVLFSLIILVILMVFQVFLFEPYYRSTKMSGIKSVVEELSENLDDITALSDITRNNDGCAVIVTPEGSQGIDSIGSSCLIYRDSTISTEYLDMLRESQTGELSLLPTTEDQSQEMLIYGKTYRTEDGQEYYVLFNTPLHPLSSTIEIIRRQYVYIMALTLVAALLISLFFSSRLSRPIEAMQKEAQKMSEGNYKDARFRTDSSFKELNDLSETLNTTSREMASLNELRTDLIANVSHDIRTPLTIIQANAEMIRDIHGEDEAKRNKDLENILQEVEYMDKLVNDMSEMTKMESGQVKLNISDFDLGGVIDATADKFAAICREEKIRIEQEVEPELIARADKFRITEVIYNFLGNATKHVGSDKKVIIRAFLKDKKTIRVEVEDHGTGIPPEALSHIWERYYKTDMTYQRARQGTGLGLAISKAILDRHKAVYGVSSEPDQGSLFYFEIPSATGEAS